MRRYLGGYVLVSVFCVFSSSGRVLADDGMEFSLDEAEGGSAAGGAAAAGRLDPEAQVAKALGELRWGMSSKELLALFKARLRAEYEAEVRNEPDIVRQDALYQRSRARYEAIKRGFVVFDGHKTGWDVAPIAPEFRHGSHEAMLVVKGEGSRDHYFFVNNRLWKWYRELEPNAQGRADFEVISETMQRQLGPTTREQAARAEGTPVLASVSWKTPDTKVTVLDRDAQTCLVFESRRTLQALSTLRKHAIARGPQRHAIVEGIFMDEAERDSWRESQDAQPNPIDARLARQGRSR